VAEDRCDLLCLDLEVAAGILRFRRDGKVVFYALTDEGRALLNAVLSTTEALP